MTPTERQRIERDAEKLYPHHLDGNYRFAYIAGATTWHDKARNQAIQDCIDILINDDRIIFNASDWLERFESLKTKP